MLTCYLLNQTGTRATIVDVADFVKEDVSLSAIRKLLDTKRLVLLDRSEILSYTCINTLIYKILQACKKDGLKDWVKDHAVPLCDYAFKGDCLGLYRLYDYSATLGKYVIILKYTDGIGILTIGLNTEYSISFVHGSKEYPRVRSQYPCCAGYVHKNIFNATDLRDNGVYLAIELKAGEVIYREVT